MRGLALLLLLPSAARADDLQARLSVEHSVGAEACAGREELERRVEGIVHRPLAASSASPGLSIDVRFERVATGTFVARVSASGPKPGQRVLRDNGPTCDALSEAVAVTIALLLDSAQVEAASAEPAPATPPERVEAPATEPTTPEPAPVRPTYSWSARASLEGGAGYGLASTGALLGLARIGGRYGPWAFDLGLNASWPMSDEFEGGSVETSLLFGNLRGCYLLGRSFAVGPCAQLGLGRLRGEGSGYEQAEAVSLPWLAAGLGLAGEAPVSSTLYVSLAATLWVPTERHTFSVQNAGIAWESKRVAGVVTAGLGLVLF